MTGSQWDPKDAVSQYSDEGRRQLAQRLNPELRPQPNDTPGQDEEQLDSPDNHRFDPS
jgi:hypothetical protein